MAYADKLFVTSLGKIATFNGGLTNSAIYRIKLLSESELYRGERFLIHYCSNVEPSEKIENYYRGKYSLKSNIEFINAHDAVRDADKEAVNYLAGSIQNERYFVGGAELNYFEYLTFCLNDLIGKFPGRTVYLFMDTPFTPEYRLGLFDSRIKRIFLVHSEHLSNSGYNYHWKLNPYKARAYFQPIKDAGTASVFFTESQLKMVQKREGAKSNYHYVPHAYDCGPSAEHRFERENKIVYVGKIENNVKQVQLIIDAFAKSEVAATLEIYGSGPDSQRMKDYVKSLGLSEKIVFKGFVSDSRNAFSQAKLSISLTRFEGFGLSILESLANGCPVIASDVLYGPQELVVDGVNGFLVENNLEKVSDRIREFFERDLFSRFSSHAIKQAGNYTSENFVRRWTELLRGLEESDSDNTEVGFPPYFQASLGFSSLKIKISVSHNWQVSLRAYSTDLLDFREVPLRMAGGNIPINMIKGRLLSLTFLSDKYFFEKEILITKQSSVSRFLGRETPKSIRKMLPGENNLPEKFCFLEL